MSNTCSYESDDASDDEDQSLMAKEESDSDKEDIFAFMTNFILDVNDDQTQVNFDKKEKIHTFSKKNIFFVLYLN